VTIRDSTYLRVPRDVAELLRVMASKICSVNFRIDEKECTLIYSSPNLVLLKTSLDRWLLSKDRYIGEAVDERAFLFVDSEVDAADL